LTVTATSQILAFQLVKDKARLPALVVLAGVLRAASKKLCIYVTLLQSRNLLFSVLNFFTLLAVLLTIFHIAFLALSVQATAPVDFPPKIACRKQ
jgi:hypothetical protein